MVKVLGSHGLTEKHQSTEAIRFRRKAELNAVV